ncbi:ComEC/Rec2-related protein [Mycoplasmopsis pulmonis]|nr:ComEC/Rec2 family competence protein [Mycoplasmopsis pulmonis]MDZ7293529.1 ComEC/Rec2 family competence protein [Mycoplasmopsis pulmonis]VEU68225.1 ComEC/Rec2-related protein [Mycoplasmopsis pulmonis]
MQVEANYAISQKYKNGYVIQNNFQRILLITNKDLDQNFIYKIKGKQEKLDNSNYANFLKSNFVFSTIKTKEITKTFSNKSFRNKIKNYFENSPSYYQKYVPLILLNHKSQINQKEYKSIENLGIVHLVVISGFHINLIFWLLNFAFNKVKIKPFYSNFFSIFLISSLVILLGISMPIYRVLFFYYFKFFYESFIYKKGKVKISKIQILLISLVAIFTINPNVIFSLSTIFTYSITFVILWSSKFKFKNKILKALFISFLAYATSALILIIFQNKIYPFAFFYSIIFSPIISFVFIVSVLFFWLKNFIDFIYLIFDKLIQSLNTFSLVWELKF